MPKLGAGRVHIALIRWQLTQMMGSDPLMGKHKRRSDVRRERIIGEFQLASRNCKLSLAQTGPVEAGRELEYRFVALFPHRGQDRTDRILDIMGLVPPRIGKGFEAPCEAKIGRAEKLGQ
jgi:hypothetical protein